MFGIKKRDTPAKQTPRSRGTNRRGELVYAPVRRERKVLPAGTEPTPPISRASLRMDRNMTEADVTELAAYFSDPSRLSHIKRLIVQKEVSHCADLLHSLKKADGASE